MTQESSKSNSVLITVAIITLVGTIAAALITTYGNYNVEKLRQEAESTRVALALLATPTVPNIPQVVTPILPTSTNLPSPTALPVKIELPTEVKTERTGFSKVVEYSEKLLDGEVIVGQSYGFTYQGAVTLDCSVFLIRGAGQYTFTVEDGVWRKYINVKTIEQQEALLQEQINIMRAYSCSENATETKFRFKITRIP